MLTTVLFDLDDTLTDAAHFGASTLVRAAEERGHALSVPEIQQYPGVAYLPLVQQLLGVPGHEAAAIYARYVALYRDTMHELRAQSGATELLRALAERGVRMALVTNKLEALAREIVDAQRWSSYLPAIVGVDSSPYRKPDPALVRHALEVLGGVSTEAAAVGDSVDDMAGASGAGVPLVLGMLVTTPAERLRAAGATHLCADLHEARALLLERASA
ncbi:MAG: HAD family hydrolase [Dehalococcoidia bacterium]